MGRSAKSATSGCGPRRLTTTRVSRFTTTPEPPTSAKRANCSALRRVRLTVCCARVVLTVAHLIRRILTPQTLHSTPPREPAYVVGAGSVRSMPTLRFRGPVLPDGEPRDLYVVDGRITLEQQAGAETAAEGWIVPGLVDAHCHIGLDAHGAVDDATTEEQAVADRDVGALLLRDCGSPADTRWVQDRDDLPRLIRCGRHLARTRRYIRDYAHEVEPADLAGLRRAGGAGGRRLGEARRRLDLARRGRPHAVVPRRDLRHGDRHRPRARRAGDRPLLRRDGAARADRAQASTASSTAPG